MKQTGSQAANLASHEYRDSAGRTREEAYYVAKPRPTAPDSAKVEFSLVTIDDPVLGVRFVLDVVNRVAHRQSLPPAKKESDCGIPNHPVKRISYERPSSGGAAKAAWERAFPCPTAAIPFGGSKKLGKRTIEDIETQGLFYAGRPGRLGMVNPSNVRPMQYQTASLTEEIWRSPELRLTLLSIVHIGPLVETHSLLHLRRDEPDPALFRVPADYRVVDEPGDFTIPVRLD
jgi:hypothetical protein